MLWEIADDIKQYIKMTLIPSMRNLFSSWRSLAGMLLVMLVLQMLLSVICIFGIENIKNQQTVLDNFESSLASVSDTVEDDNGSFITSDTFKTALAGTSIFIGAVIIWGVCALTVYAKVTFAAADRDKYMWGMLVTHGAKKKKIRSMLKNELYLPQLVATAIAYPLSLWLCNYTLSELGYGYSHSLLTLLVILVLSYVCIRLVVAYEAFLIRSMSCTDMLREEDSPKSVCFPRRHCRLVRGFTPFRYATNTFIRMRKYYLSLALIAAVPALIWVCLQVSATSQDSYLESDVNEFTVTLADGIDGTQLESIAKNQLGDIDGISSVTASASYDASRIYTHLLLGKQHYTDTSASPYLTATYTDSTVRLCTSNAGTKFKTGINMTSVPEGSVRIFAPVENTKYNIQPESKLTLAVSRGGSITVADGVGRFDGDFEYITLTVSDVTLLHSEDLVEGGFTHLTDTYFVLSQADYERISGRKLASYSEKVSPDAYSYTEALDERGNFTVTVPLTDFSETLSEGDIIELRGRLTMGITLTTDEDTYSKRPTNASFYQARINSASVTGDTVTLNVAPYYIIKMGQQDYKPPVVLAFGTPPLQSGAYQHFALTTDSMELVDAHVTVSSIEITLNKDASLIGSDVGAHAILSKKQITSENGITKLEELYADNDFILTLGDSMTLSTLGLDISNVKDGYATVILPSDSYLALKVGDKIRLAVTLEDVLTYDESASVQTSSYDTLDEHIKKNVYDYVVVYVGEIIYSDEAEQPRVFLSTSDFSRVIDKDAPYTRLNINIDAYIESCQYAQIREQLSYWATLSQTPTRISSTGNYLQYLLRKSANYAAVMKIISMLVPLIIPFIWYYPLASLFDRRKSEVRVLEAMGKKKRTLRTAFVLEGLLVAIAAFLAVPLLCLPAMFVFKSVCTLAHLPLEFEYEFLNMTSLMLAGAASALCALISYLICYGTTSSGRIKKQRNRRN